MAYKSTRVGAEYHVLRNPEKYFLVGADEAGTQVQLLFPNGFINKTMTEDDLKAIAHQMNGIVIKLCRDYKRVKYTPKQIREELQLIYRYRSVENKSTENKSTENDDKSIIILGLRKNKSKVLPGSERKKQEIIGDTDLVLTDPKFVEVDTADLFIDRILEMLLPAVGEGREQEVRTQLSNWINTSEDGQIPFTGEIFKKYRNGLLMLL